MNTTAVNVASRFAPDLKDSTSPSRKFRDKIFLLGLWIATLVGVLTLFFLVLSTLLTECLRPREMEMENL